MRNYKVAINNSPAISIKADDVSLDQGMIVFIDGNGKTVALLPCEKVSSVLLEPRIN